MVNNCLTVQELYGLNPLLSDNVPATGELYLTAPHDLDILNIHYGKAMLTFVDTIALLKGNTYLCRIGDAGYKGSKSSIRTRRAMATDKTVLADVLTCAYNLLCSQGTAALLVDADTFCPVKLAADEIFGKNMQFNEIVLYTPGRSTVKHCFAQKHKTLLLYGRTKQRYIDTGACGTLRGTARRNHMKRKEENGRAYVTMQSGGKEYRYYEDDAIPFDDVWQLDEISKASNEKRKEEQLNAEVYRRLLLCLTKPGDTAVRFCGVDGTFCVNASTCGRQFIGWDYNPIAIAAARMALLDTDGISFKLLRTLPQDNSGIIGLNALVRNGRQEIMLCSYTSDELTCGIDGISFWAIGTVNGNTYTVQDYSQRSSKMPSIRTSLSKSYAYNGFVCICDAYGNEKYIMLDKP